MENSRPQIPKFYCSSKKPIVTFDDCSIDIDKDSLDDDSEVDDVETDNFYDFNIPKENVIPRLNLPFQAVNSNSNLLTEKNIKQNYFLTAATKDTDTTGPKRISNAVTNLNSKMNSINNVFKDNNLFFSSLKSDDEDEDEDFIVENNDDDDIEMFEDKYRSIKETTIVPCMDKDLAEINKFNDEYKNKFINNNSKFVNHDNNISYSNSSESFQCQIKKNKDNNSESNNFRLNCDSQEINNNENNRYLFCKIDNYETKNNNKNNINNNNAKVNNNNYLIKNTENKNINSISINSLNEKGKKSNNRKNTILNLTKPNKIFQKFLCLGIDTSWLYTLDNDLKILSLDPKITYNYPYNNLEKELE